MGGDELEKMGMSFERSIRGPVIKGGRTDKGSCKEWEQFADFFGDLHHIAACDGLVGKLTSNFDRLALALMTARMGSIPPFISLDNSTYCNNAVSTWGASAFGAFPCRMRTLDDPKAEDATLLHELDERGKVRIAMPRRMPSKGDMG